MEELKKTLIYENKLSCPEDVRDFIMEGSAKITFENGKMQMSSMLDEALGQKANFVFWCNQDFPENIMIQWKFVPKAEVGLCMTFFAASGRDGKDLFDPSLARRDGQYGQYHSGDINAFHISYYRTNFRNNPKDELPLRTCNLRKSRGFYLAAMGADPIPELPYCRGEYTVQIMKFENVVEFYINGLKLFRYEDDGKTYGPLLGGGKIGFRQMVPMVGEYSDLEVYRLER